MKKIVYVIIFLIAGNCFAQFSRNRVIENGNTAYLSNTVMIKLKTAPAKGSGRSVNLSVDLTKNLESFGIRLTKQYVPFQIKTESSLNKIVVVEYENEIDPLLLAAKLSKLKDVEWAEPRYVRKINYVPNDPSLASQYNLNKINAQQAWDLSKGDSSIIIAIVDTGIDWDHPDLAANIWINKNEIPGNGVDDDNNGFVDDVRGWDFGGLNGTADNNPMEDRPDHGTHVAGIAGAVTDNNIGISSIGFSSSVMAVKVSQDNLRNTNNQPFIVYPHEGIIYAAENGAKVINCSFGGAGYSILEQEIIDFAVSQGALVVAAAGNQGQSQSYYPASYQGVLSVASTNSIDSKSNFSNYGITVDVAAPGENILSTWQNDSYANISGTSMSSPLAAGLAALVFQRFPFYSPLQIAEQIRVNTDDINNINPNYRNLLGTGRINAFKALNNSNSISVRAVDFEISDEVPGGNGNGIIQSGETILIGVKFRNYLNPTSSLSISLESANPGAVVENGNFTAGSVAALDSFDNSSSRFSVRLGSSVPQNTNLVLTLIFTDGSYSDFQSFNITVNPTFATQAGGNVTLTITSSGTLAFNDYPNNLLGSGFHYLGGENHLFEGALILGTSSKKISDAARGADQSVQNKDFTIVEPFKLESPGAQAEQQGSTVFNDNGAGSNKIGVTVKLDSYSYASEPDRNYIILNYGITNTSGAQIENLFVGLFFDWDMIEGVGADDFTAYDHNGNLGYAHHPAGSPDNFVGAALISSDQYGFWAIMNPGDSSGFSIYDDFTDAEKWDAISKGIGKLQAGYGDVSNIVSGGPFSIPAGQTHNIAFAVMADQNLDDLRNSAANARAKYQTLVTGTDEDIQPFSYELIQNYPNPFNPSTVIRFQLAETGKATLKVYDILGKEIAAIVNEELPAGEHKIEFNAGNNNLSSGVYFYRLQTSEFSETKKMILLR